jgi:hypothetical protein
LKKRQGQDEAREIEVLSSQEALQKEIKEEL